MSKSRKRRIYRRHSLHLKRTVQFRESTLANGLKILSEEVPGLESFSLGICINAGSRDETEQTNGTAHFIEHVNFRQTKHGTSKSISSKFEDVGAYVNAFTTKENTVFYVRALKKHLKRSFSLLCDVVFNGNFNQKDMNSERSIILEEIKYYLDDPEEMIFDHGEKLLFGNHGLGMGITGTVESVSNLDTSALELFYRKFYVPSNIIITAAGNIDHDKIVKLAEERFPNSVANGEAVSRKPPRNIETDVFSGTHKGTQTHALFCRRIDGSFREKYPVLILNEFFSSGMSSRLQNKLRENRGLAYNLDSEIQRYSDCGSFGIYCSIDDKNLAETEDIISSEMQKVAAGKITKAEVRRAKEQIKSSFIMENESMSARMGSLAGKEFHNEPKLTSAEILQMIESIPASEISLAAEKYFNPDDWSKVILRGEK